MLSGLLLAAACGSDDDPSSSPDTTASATSPEATEPDATTGPGESSPSSAPASSAPASDLDPDGTLRWAAPYFNETSIYDPHLTSTATANVYFFPTYDRLVHLAPDASPVPGLATEWSFQNDGLVLEFKLREGVTFHDGEPFNAEAVKANLERGQTLEGSTVVSDLAVVESIEVVDDLTVRLNLSEPDSALPLVLSDRAGIMMSPLAFEGDTLLTQPVGAGMYRVTEFVQGSYAVYEPFEDYWDPSAVGVARLEIHHVPDPVSRLNGLRTGEFDGTELDLTMIEEARGEGFEVTTGPGLVFYTLYLNRARSEFGNPLVREAIQHAIDRELIVSTLAAGNGQVASQPFPEDYVAFNTDAVDMYPYDPDRARELLAEAGFPDGFSFETVIPTIDVYVQHAEAIQAQLAEVGIDMQLTQLENLSQQFFVEQARDSFFSIWTGRPDPLMTTGLLYTSEGFNNPGRVSTPEVDALHKEARSTTDPDTRAALLKELSLQIMEDNLAIPVYFPDQAIAFRSGIVGLEPWMSGKIEFRGVGVQA